MTLDEEYLEILSTLQRVSGNVCTFGGLYGEGLKTLELICAVNDAERPYPDPGVLFSCPLSEEDSEVHREIVERWREKTERAKLRAVELFRKMRNKEGEKQPTGC